MSKPYETIDNISSQPFQAFVDIYIHDLKLKNIPPKYLKTFEIEEMLIDGVGSSTFTLELVDEYWDELEYNLNQNMSDNETAISFRYGHVNGRQSIMYHGFVSQYSIEFNSYGITLVVIGSSVSNEAMLSTSSGKFSSKDPTDVVRQLIEKQGWTIGRIDPAVQILNDDGSLKEFTMINDKVLPYISKEIAPYCIRASDGKGGYQFYLDESTNPATAHFHPIDIANTTDDLDSSLDRTYVYQKGINGPVLDWRYDNKGSSSGAYVGNMSIAGEIESTTINPITKEVTTINKDVRDVDVAEGEYTNTTTLNTAIVDLSGYNKQEVSSHIDYKIKADREPYTATLTIVGDPTIDLNTKIRMIVITPKGDLHHSSGRYTVTKVLHRINSGIMTTVITMMRLCDIEGGVDLVRYKKLYK